MRAAVLNSVPGQLEIEDLSIDKPRANEVLLHTHACGLCHSDLSVMEGGLPFPVPAVLGHEAAGVVAAVGSDVTEFAVGDRVVACLSSFCGHCDECVIGNTWLCTNRDSLQRSTGEQSRIARDGEPIGQLAQLGGFAEEMLVHRNGIVTVPDEIPLDRAALLGCAVMTGVGSVVNGAKVQPGSTVAVIGAGGIGVNIIQGAILAGAARVIAVDLHPEKLELAKVFGATDVVNAGDGDPIATVVEMTKGGVDYAFEAIGLAVTAQQAMQMIKPGRTAYLVGVPPAGSMVELPGLQMAMQGRGLQGLFLGSNQFKRDIPMLADLYIQGRLELDAMIANRITLDEVNDGYDRMRLGTEARSVIVFQ